jgi:hypothetical protein
VRGSISVSLEALVPRFRPSSPVARASLGRGILPLFRRVPSGWVVKRGEARNEHSGRWLLLALLVFLCGCRNQADHGEELSYLRPNPEVYEPREVGTKDLLPLVPGARWRYKVTRPDGKESSLETTALSGQVLEGRTEGKLESRDTYRFHPAGISIVGTYLDGPAPITPELPLLSLPLKEGEITTWQGTIGTNATTLPARAWVRVTRREKVHVPAGDFATWRVDMRTDVMKGRSQALLVTRWLAPGVGVVRMRLVQGKNLTLWELVEKKSVSSATNGVK